VDPDDTTIRPSEWWNELGGEGPKPYNHSAWTYTLAEESLFETVDGQALERKLGIIQIYDSLASSPGALGSILQPLGVMGTDPEAASSNISTDPEGVSIELVRSTVSGDDIPPGTLLASISYEIFLGVFTILDWEHLNWADDSPIVLGIKTLLRNVPGIVSEVRVQNNPRPFWTSLGFTPDYKGDPYLHIHL
jgi:hypothetical protein